MNFNFQFEDDLPAKYGSFKVEKRHDAKPVEVRDENGNITHTYLKYELKVKSLEGSSSIPNICITDVLSTENWLNKSNVIAGNGYVGVNTTVSSLGSSENGRDPYETIYKAENDHGTVVLDNNNLKWQITELKPNEERTLVYYVELNEKYVGSGSAGTLRNEAKPESNGYKRESVRDEFIPKADADISKTQSSITYDAFGNGKISYTVKVTANQNNSYTITDAYIRDAFGSGMGNYVKENQEVDVTIKSSKGTESQTSVTIDSHGFNVPVDKLTPGETLTITYSLELQQLFSHSNGDVSFTNNAAFVGGNKDGKLKKGYTFKSSGATTYVTHNQWMRKMNGQTVDSDKTITITNNGENVYNYDRSKSNATEFTVPQNAQEYTVIVNEDGTWNMSNTHFKDDFQDARIAYTGYLKIEEFDKLSSIGTGNNLSDNQALQNLNEVTPNKTVYIDIDGKSSFDIKPQDYGLTDASKVYRLTYYAAVNANVTNVKNVIVANNFSITGDIGYGDRFIHLNGIYTAVSSTLVSSASYEFDKESLFYENVYNHEYTGEIYWIIRANGTLTKGMHIQDKPTDTAIRPDSMIGVYIGDKDHDFSGFTSFNELNEALSEMEVCSVGTSKYFYNLQSISSSADLDGKDLAIFSRKKNNGYAGYLTRNQNGNNNIEGKSLSAQITFGTDIETTEEVPTWHFERVGTTDNFYIYYTDMSGTHYMHISAGSSTISDTPMQLTVSIDNNNNLIKIANPNVIGSQNCSDGEALNWCGGDNKWNINYSGWKNVNTDPSNWHYLGILDNSTKYKYTPQKIANTNDLNGKQFAIITPGTNNSGLLVGEHSGDNALTGEWYTEKFNGDPPTITRTSSLQKWTFEKKTGGANDEFYVYYTDANKQRHYLSLGNSSATTTVAPATVIINCRDDKIHLKTPDGSYALDWYGGGQGAQNNERYSTWKNNDSSNNQLHYVAEEEVITASSSIYGYNWSANGSEGNFIINEDTVIPHDKSMYIVLRTYPKEAVPTVFSKIFDNEISIKDDANGSSETLDRASYLYKPNLPLRKEGMVAAYYNAEGTTPEERWKVCSVSPKETRDDGCNVWTNIRYHVFKNERELIQGKGSGLYVEWLMNVNWDGTLEGDVILTDHLNNKMEPVLVRQFNLGKTSEKNPPEYKTIPELEDDPDWTKSQTHEIPFYYNETTGELKAAIGNLHTSVIENSAVVNLQLICRVTDPDVIFSGANTTLNNKADLTGPDGALIGKQDIEHEILPTYSINKKVDGAKDDNKKRISNKLTYTIEINPTAEDLIDGDTLPVLIDEMTGKLTLMGTVGVYQNSVSEAAKLNDIIYSVTNNAGITQIKFENLPDQTHLIIQYKATVNVQQEQTADISNIAYWEGYKLPSTPQHSEAFVYKLSGSVAVRDNPVVEINKLDFYDNSITLSGAEFEIRKVNIDGTVDNSLVASGKTGNDGKIRLENGALQCNIVYQMKEVKAPSDYVLDTTPKYFMVIDEESPHDYTIDNDNQMTIGNEPVDVIISYISGDDTDLDLTVYNKKARIEVNKVFLDESGKLIDPNDVKFFGTYRFGLYYRDPATNSQARPIQILSITYSNNGVSYTLDGKTTNEPVFTKARANNDNRIYELNRKDQPILNGKNEYLNGYSFDVNYENLTVVGTANGVVKTAAIKNKYHPIYMPATGGMGLKNYYKTAFCVLMILSALTAAAFVLRRKCR